MATRTVDNPRSTRAAPAREGEVLTLKAAADLLNVDRTSLVQLLDAGALPSTGKGPQRYVRKDDLLAYKREWDARRAEARDRLLDLSLEAGLDTADYDALLADRP